jgi:hypothetical protein
MLKKLYPNSFEEFDAEAFEMQVRMWERAFVDYSYRDCAIAFEKWFNLERKLPHPIDIKNILIKAKNPTAYSPERAWEIVSTAVKNFGSHNQKAAFDTFSEAIKRGVHNVGGWQSICETPLGTKWDFLRKHFMESYVELDRDNREHEALPSPVLKRIQELAEQEAAKRLERPDEPNAL